jgi:hypothetical protein
MPGRAIFGLSPPVWPRTQTKPVSRQLHAVGQPPPKIVHQPMEDVAKLVEYREDLRLGAILVG